MSDSEIKKSSRGFGYKEFFKRKPVKNFTQWIDTILELHKAVLKHLKVEVKHSEYSKKSIVMNCKELSPKSTKYSILCLKEFCRTRARNPYDSSIFWNKVKSPPHSSNIQAQTSFSYPSKASKSLKSSTNASSKLQQPLQEIERWNVDSSLEDEVHDALTNSLKKNNSPKIAKKGEGNILELNVYLKIAEMINH